jgi:hypothetical protein
MLRVRLGKESMRRLRGGLLRYARKDGPRLRRKAASDSPFAKSCMKKPGLARPAPAWFGAG